MSAGRLGQFAEILDVSPARSYLGVEILREAFSDRAGESDTDFQRSVCDLLIAYLEASSTTARLDILTLVRGSAPGRLKERAAMVFDLRPPWRDEMAA